jgi:electron transport complex protein RnfG
MKKFNPGVWTFLILGLVTASALTWFSDFTRPMLAKNIERKRIQLLETMLPSDRTHITLQSFELFAPNYLNMGDSQIATRVILEDTPQEVIFTALSKKAYHDRIAIMAAFDKTCTVNQVEIISERETPGLGDQYKFDHFAWLKSLSGKTVETHWALKPKGEIDSWTAATVTPQAMIDTVNHMQQLCVQHNALLFGHQDIVSIELDHPEK